MFLWLKAAHVTALIIWLGGLFTLSAALFSLPRSASSDEARDDARLALKRWDRAITIPAMFATWGLGILLATQLSAFSETWLQIKLVFVVFLSGMHGVLSGLLRRTADTTPSQREQPAFITVALLICSIAIIAVLVIARPI